MSPLVDFTVDLYETSACARRARVLHIGFGKKDAKADEKLDRKYYTHKPGCNELSARRFAATSEC
jgi:hypothetical protein